MISSKILSDSELRRFGKQISLPQIGLEGQETLKKARVAVIGAGGLGTVVLQYLAASGIGNIGIIDYALVEEINIQQQTLYGGNDLGKLKTIISKQNLQNLFPLVNVEIINLQLTSDNIDRIIQPFDLVVDSTNDVISSQVICKSCESLKVPWIYGSISDFSGKIAVFDSSLASGCSYIKSLDSLIPASDIIKNGASCLACGLLGNLMALEVVKYLIKNPDALINKVLSIDVLSYTFTTTSLNFVN